MQTLNRLCFKSIWYKLVLVFVIQGLFYSCSQNTDWYFKESGSLLWVNGSHSDEAVKKAVHYNLTNSSVIVAQIPWSPNDTSYFENARWYFSLAQEHGKAFMINIDWQKSDRSGVNGEWNFKNENIANRFESNMIDLVKTYSPD